eukprot:8883_1
METAFKQQLVSFFKELTFQLKQISHQGQNSQCVHHKFVSINEYKTNIITIIKDSFDDSENEQVNVIKTMKTIDSFIRIRNKGACLKCISLIGGQITHLYVKHCSVSCQMSVPKISTNFLYTILLSNTVYVLCLSYPSISDYFIKKTSIIRLLIYHYFTLSRYHLKWLNDRNSHPSELMTKYGKYFVMNLISFKSKLWIDLIHQQWLLPDLIK